MGKTRRAPKKRQAVDLSATWARHERNENESEPGQPGGGRTPARWRGRQAEMVGSVHVCLRFGWAPPRPGPALLLFDGTSGPDS